MRFRLQYKVDPSVAHFDPEMNMENGSFTRCVRHPSQFFTGFCSSCLVERLSSVDNASQRSPEPSTAPRIEQVVDLSNPTSDSQSRPTGVRVRKTLLSLFHLDDGDCISIEKEENYMRDQLSIPNSNGSQNMKAGVNSENMVRLDASGSSSAVDDSNIDACTTVKKLEPVEDECWKQKGVSYWLGTVFSRKLKWGMASHCKKNSLNQRSVSGNFGEKWPNRRTSFRHSYDLKTPCDSNKSSWEDPRHSWDGSMMSRAFTCSFACGEEAEDGNLDNLVETDAHSRRRNKCLHEGATLMDLKTFSGTTDARKINEESLSEEMPSSSDSRPRKSLTDRFHEEQHQNISVPRRKSRRWSKVWNWSITSPFRDSVQKGERVLGRSLSESWQECRDVRNADTMESESVLHLYGGNGATSARTNFTSHRSKCPGNGDIGCSRVDWQNKKREYTFGRSRSVHYSSPGNLDNGLLRFYLTPLRSSRRMTNKGRMKTSRSFAKGILGFH